MIAGWLLTGNVAPEPTMPRRRDVDNLSLDVVDRTAFC